MLTHQKQLLLLARSSLRIISANWVDIAQQPHEPQPAESQTNADRVWRRQSTQTHSLREAMLVINGQVQQSLNGKVYLGRPGTLFLYDAGDQHDKGFPQSAPDSDQMWMFFANDFITCGGVELRGGRYVTDFRYIHKSAPMLRRLNNAWDALKNSPVDEIKQHLALAQLQASFKLLFAEVVADAWQKERGEKNPHTAAEAIREVANFLEQTTGQTVDVATLARMAGFSRSHFLRLFQKYVGMTVKQFVNQTRQQHYEKLTLAQTPMKVIAAELGFKSSSALAHWRRKHF